MEYTSNQHPKKKQRFMPPRLSLPINFKNQSERAKLIHLYQNQMIEKTDATNPIRFDYRVDLIRNKQLNDQNRNSSEQQTSNLENTKIDTEGSESPRGKYHLKSNLKLQW